MNAGSAAQSDYSLRINEALNRWQQLGYADDQVSSVLGVGVGTPTTDQSYQNWQKMRAQQDADWQREQWRYQQELDKYSQNEQQRQNAYNLAMTMLQLGQMPSAEMLAQAGISGEDAKRILAGVQAQSGGYSGGSGGSSGGGSYSSGSGAGADREAGRDNGRHRREYADDCRQKPAQRAGAAVLPGHRKLVEISAQRRGSVRGDGIDL